MDMASANGRHTQTTQSLRRMLVPLALAERIVRAIFRHRHRRLRRRFGPLP